MIELGLPLRTERLVLRAFTDDDVDDVFAYRGRSEVFRYLLGEPWTRERTEQVLRHAAKCRVDNSGDPLVLAVATAEDDRAVADIQLVPGEFDQGEIGWVFNPEVAGQGYATEAARALLGLAFDVVGMHRVCARLNAENDASVRLCERLGMRREAHLVENQLVRGQWVSELCYAILDREWRAAR